jgi:hypothetical protein
VVILGKLFLAYALLSAALFGLLAILLRSKKRIRKV